MPYVLVVDDEESISDAVSFMLRTIASSDGEVGSK
jgi:FixJ family two-component response regulator